MKIVNEVNLYLVFLTFLVLKLTNNIDWSWWWVTSPLWGGVVAAYLTLFVMWVVERALVLYIKLAGKK